jgi:hypothetical protein
MGIISNLTIRFAFSRMGIDNNLTVFSFNQEKLGRIDGHANFIFLPVTPFFSYFRVWQVQNRRTVAALGL